MVGLVETMMTADSLRLTAYGPDESVMRIVKDLPKAKTPHEQESLQRQIAATIRQIDQLVYELYGLTEDEANSVEGVDGRLVEYGVTLTQNERRARSTRSFVARVASQ